jgi:hypothetical protein
MATPFDRLMDTIKPHLPGAMEDAIRQELFMTCSEFFKMSNTWREELDVTVLAGTNTAHFMPFAGRVERLLAVKSEDGRPVYGVHIQEKEILKFRHPVTSDTNYTALFALTVNDPLTRDAYPVIPWDLVQQYQDELISGILSRMMAQPSKPYTNLGLAQYHRVAFRGGASRAKNSANEGSTFGSQHWRFPQSFATAK